MIYKRTFLPLGQDLHEDALPGLTQFNISANMGDIEKYIEGYIPLHWHAELEIFQLLEGSVDIEVENQTITLEPGEGCFINTGILHAYRAKRHAYYHSFVFDAGIVGGAPGSIFDTRYVQPLLKDGPSFLKINREDTSYHEPHAAAFTACEKEAVGYELEVRAQLSKILLFLLEKAAETHEVNPHRFSPDEDRRIKQCLEWIDLNLEKKVMLNDIASAANISPRECQRLFKNCLCRRPMEYLLYRRLLRAAQLLADEGRTITETAFACGFDSPSYFTKKFRELTGVAPSRYRDLLCDKNSDGFSFETLDNKNLFG